MIDDLLRNVQHYGGALGARHARPWPCVKRLSSCPDGELDVLGRRLWPNAHRLADVAGALALDHLARLRIDRLAADEHLVAARCGEAGVGKIRLDVALHVAHGQKALAILLVSVALVSFSLLYGTVW